MATIGGRPRLLFQCGEIARARIMVWLHSSTFGPARMAGPIATLVSNRGQDTTGLVSIVRLALAIASCWRFSGTRLRSRGACHQNCRAFRRAVAQTPQTFAASEETDWSLVLFGFHQEELRLECVYDE